VGTETKAAADAASCSGSLAAQLLSLTGVDDLSWIDGVAVDLFLQNLSVFADQKVYPARGFVFINVNSVLAGHVSSPIAQQRESNTDLVCKGLVGKGAVHAHTQNLGVGGFQLLKVLLEGLHLRGSTASECKNVKRDNNIALAAVLAK
jgi:hypothetical protein